MFNWVLNAPRLPGNHFDSMSLHMNPLTTNITHHIENSQLVCGANQLTGLYMTGNIGR